MKNHISRHSETISKLTLAALLAGAALASGCAPAMEVGDEEQTPVESQQALRAQWKPGVATGQGHAVALRADGTVWGWGANGSGQLGDGTTTERLTPVQVSNLPEAGTSVESVWAGYYHSMALLSDGTVRAWGYNGQYGQLGDGTTTQRTVPVKVLKNPATGEALSGVVALAAGYSHTLALDSSGHVWAWGDNFTGALGDGTNINRKTPVQVPLSGVVAIAADRSFSLAALSDGTVWAWGTNVKGQLGNGTKVASSTPVQVLGISDAVEVGAGNGFSFAVLSDGSMRAWGDNYRGNLGDGSKENVSLTPVVVSNMSGAFAVDGSANGAFFTVALKQDGSVWAWGSNGSGQLGDGMSECYKCPYCNEVISLQPTAALIDQVDSVTASVATALARRTDGTFWFWGSNTMGLAGNGIKGGGCTMTPVQVQFPSP